MPGLATALRALHVFALLTSHFGGLCWLLKDILLDIQVTIAPTEFKGNVIRALWLINFFEI